MPLTYPFRMPPVDLFSSSSLRSSRLFSAVQTQERFALARIYLCDLYDDAASRNLLDPQFLSAFPIEFPQRCWELVLIRLLSALGFNLTRVGKAGPDLLCEVNGGRFYVEAVAPRDSENGPPVQPGRVKDGDQKTGYIIERLFNSIVNKREKWNGWLQRGQVDQTLPYVVALSQLEIADFSDEHGARDAIRTLLYAEGYRVIEIDTGTLVSLDRGRQHQDETSKANRAPLTMGLFRPGSEAAKEISALLYFENYDLASLPSADPSHLQLHLNQNAFRPLGILESSFALGKSPRHSDGGSEAGA